MCSFCSKGFYNKQCLDVHINAGICDNFNLSKKGLGILGNLSLITEAKRYKLQTPLYSSCLLYPESKKRGKCHSIYQSCQ